MLEFRILGPLEVVGQESLALGGHRQKAVLAVLLLHRGEAVPSDRLIEAVWGGRPPARADKSVHVYVSNLRKALGDGLLVTRGRGYLLAVDADQVDRDRFEKLASKGREALQEGDASKARMWLQAALTLWRGPALADFAYESFAQSEIARLDEARLAALENRIEADLTLGQDAALVPELEALVHENPTRERLYEHLMVALYRSGRQVDALERYQRARRKLIDEFGIEPGPRLTEIQRAVLSQDASLDVPEAASGLEEKATRRLPRLRRFSGLTLLLRRSLVVGPRLGRRLQARLRKGGALALQGTRRAPRADQLVSELRRRLPQSARSRWLSAGATAVVVAAVAVPLSVGGGNGGRSGAQAPAWARISSPRAGVAYAQGEGVPTSFSCGAAAGAPALRSCNDSDGLRTISGGSGRLDTSTVGAHRYTVTVRLKNGTTRTTSILYTVTHSVASALNASVETAHATVAHGRTQLTLACSGGGPGAICSGRLSLTVNRGSGNVQLASASYSLPAGATRSIVLPLTRAGSVALRHARGHQLRVLATATVSHGGSVERSITLKHRHRP